jgi:hypothetical protein
MEHQHQEELEDNDIIDHRDGGSGDSKISALASNLFNGMDGIG